MIVPTYKSRILTSQEKSRVGACTCLRPLRTLAAVCLAITVMARVTDVAIATTQTPSAQISTASCPHPLDEYGRQTWKPTQGQLNRILAKHRGWLQKESRFRLPLEAPDAYFNNDIKALGVDDKYVKPAFPDWRREARNNPEKETNRGSKLE